MGLKFPAAVDAFRHFLLSERIDPEAVGITLTFTTWKAYDRWCRALWDFFAMTSMGPTALDPFQRRFTMMGIPFTIEYKPRSESPRPGKEQSEGVWYPGGGGPAETFFTYTPSGTPCRCGSGGGGGSGTYPHQPSLSRKDSLMVKEKTFWIVAYDRDAFSLYNGYTRYDTRGAAVELARKKAEQQPGKSYHVLKCEGVARVEQPAIWTEYE